MKHIGIETYRGFKRLIVGFLVLVPLSLIAQTGLENDYLTLDPEAVTGLDFGSVTAVAQCPSDESVWIGTAGNGILRIGRNGRRIHYSAAGKTLLSDSIRAMCFVSPTRLYILYKNGELTVYSSTEGFARKSVIDAGISHILPGLKEGQLYLSSDTGKVYMLEDGADARLLQDFQEPLSALLLGGDGSLYAAGDRSRSVQALRSGVLSRVASPLPERAHCLAVFEDGMLWAGTGQGLYRWDGGAWNRFANRESRGVHGLVPVGSGEGRKLYLATSRGIELLDVSNPSVSNSNLFFPDESFLCAVQSVSDDAVVYFGAVRGIAAIGPATPSELLSWAADAPDEPKGRSSGRLVWRIVFLLFAAAAGFFLGRLLSPRKKDLSQVPAKPEEPARPVAPVSAPAAKYTSQVDDGSAAAASTAPPSREEVFEAIERVRRGEVPEFTQRVWQMIEDSYTDPDFSVASVASRLLLTRVHLNRKLQQEIGISPSALIKARRMIAARELMMRGGLTLPQIAEKTGFSSAAYLSASFKDYFGQSPSKLS
ncbi:MAG: helix-turn-helix domain-containing protein [Bacteroidales bacterium]|nr:helix-turn-helix domain-containing protein [Bacteroidales bacterium]